MAVGLSTDGACGGRVESDRIEWDETAGKRRLEYYPTEACYTRRSPFGSL